MRKRRANGEKAINASGSSRFSAFRDTLWSTQDNARTGAARAADSAYLALRDRILLPLEDRVELAGRAARALGAGALVLLAVLAGVAGLLWAAPDHKGAPATVAEVAAPAPAPAKAKTKPAKATAPTLHGAAPSFAGGIEADATVGAAEPLDGASAGGDTTAARRSAGGAGAKISSRPDAATAGTATSSAKSKPARGPVAGAAAIAVAREFADAFVAYEVGGAEDSAVEKAFAATTTPQLAQALLRRPPRQPAGVAVPRAKVLNVVPAPSRGGVFPVSVSLLRVGTTSELRLQMEKLKGKRWRVTNVLG